VRDSKRLLTRQRILAAAGAAAAVVFAVAASYVLHPAEHRQAVAAPGGNAAGSILAGSCISMPLRSQLAAAVQGGASVIVGADVVFTPYGCWDVSGLLPGQYQESTPLWPVPHGANFGGEHQAAENGLYTVPLATVEQIAASA